MLLLHVLFAVAEINILLLTTCHLLFGLLSSGVVLLSISTGTGILGYWDNLFSGVLISLYLIYVRRHTANMKLYPRRVCSVFSKKNSYWKLYKRFRTKVLYKYKHMPVLCTK